MQGKPYAGNPHVRFDEGAGVPRCSGRPALLYKKTYHEGNPCSESADVRAEKGSRVGNAGTKVSSLRKYIMVVLGVTGMYIHATVLEVNVPEGPVQTGFTTDQLAAIAQLTSEDEIRKTGPGTLRVESIEAIGYFTGTLRISNGVYQLGDHPSGEASAYWDGHTCLGVSGTTQVIVDGTGTLFTDHYLGINKLHYYAGTKISLSGNGYNNQGAFVVGGKTGSINNNFYLTAWRISLADDATIVKGGAAGAYSAGGCTWDLNGHTLTLKNGFDLRTHASADNERDRIISSGRIVVDGYYTYTVTPVLLNDGVVGEFSRVNGASVSLTETAETGTIYDWTNTVQSGTTLVLTNTVNTTAWKGPYLLSGNSTVKLQCAANSDYHVYNDICGDANIESEGKSGSRIYLHGRNTYTGTTTLKSGALIFMSKDSAPGWNEGKLSVVGVKQYNSIFAFAQQTAARPRGWTGAEMWNIIENFHANQWSAGAYVDVGDDFEIPSAFTASIPFSDMNFTSFGGGRVVFIGTYEDNFKVFNLESRCSNVVYSASSLQEHVNLENSWTLGPADITFENMGYCFLGSYLYLTVQGAAGASGGVGRLTIGNGTCIDISSDSLSGRPFATCGHLNGAKGIVTLTEGSVASNGVWVAVSDTASDQCGSYIQRGGEMRVDKGGAAFRIGGAMNSMAYAEIDGGLLSANRDAYLGPLYKTCVSPTAGAMFHQKRGVVDFDCTLNMPLAGRSVMRLSDGAFRVKNCLLVPNCDNTDGAYGGDASIVAEAGAQPFFASGIILGDRIGSTGVVEAVSGAMLHTPWIKKAVTTGKGGLPTGDNLAVIDFNGGGIMAVQDGMELLGSGDAAVDFAIVHANGAYLGASNGVTASISVPLVHPSGNTIASVSLPSGVPVVAPASGVIRLCGDGVGATAYAEFDSTKWCERITAVTVPSGGSGYTSATAELFIGGGVANIPLAVELEPAVTTGGIVKVGAGTIVLNSVNGYGGDTVIEQGTLRVAMTGAIPSGSTVKIRNGGLLELAADVPYPTTIEADVDFDPEQKYSLVRCLDGRSEAPVVSNLPAYWKVALRGDVWTVALQRGMRVIVR